MNDAAHTLGAGACGTRCHVMSIVLAVVAGALFGAGLLISGMTVPAKVIGFLDVASNWDPSLAFVMGGAVVVNFIATRWIAGSRKDPWFDIKFHLPTRRDIDRSLVIGAAVFGIGWGLGGLCPGPALVAASAGNTAAIAFVGAMLLGMLLQHRTAR
jgi:uncharacterized membrane protein YedE/YeeE